MNYYTVLSATSALLQQQDLTVRRCRRRFNGPHRYVLQDGEGNAFHFDEISKNRRMGYALSELLEWMAKQPGSNTTSEARSLIHELDCWQQLKAANF
jgi:hypothetical protein